MPDALTQPALLAPLESFPEGMVRARFVARHKRFIVDAIGLDGELAGVALGVHLADPGRLEGVLVEGTTLWLSGPHPAPRKLAWSLRLVEVPRPAGDVLVSVDSTLANRVMPTLVGAGVFGELPALPGMKREHKVERHRFDLAWPTHEPPWLGEIKTVSHVDSDGVGAWPDAPSTRGLGHVCRLAQHVTAGGKAAIIFATGRSDIDVVTPHRRIDPALAEAFDAALDVGVLALGVRLRMTPRGAFYAGRLPVRR